jgi:micrococcal nuclease
VIRVARQKALGPSAFLFAALLAAQAATTQSAGVRQVLDGDTVILDDGRHLRLIGINAPELGKNGAPDQPLAAQSRERLAQLVRGQRIRLVFERERQDHYGRLLAHLLLPDGSSVAQILLREGLGWAVAIPPDIDRLRENLAAESEARAARRGVWAEPAYAPVPAERLTPNDTGFRFIEGTVQRRSQRHGVIYFDLTPRVALQIPHEDWRQYFGGDPRSLVGRRVEARGWLTPYKDGRLHLRVSHPAMLTWRD